MLYLLLSPAAAAENLLANPGFEELAADKPARWDHFVQPKPGAVAETSDQAHAGMYSVWLHTPTPYEKEPVNNWSQNIIADFGGETLQVSGFIRVEDAEEAALWLQLWRKRPWGVLGAESTSVDMPVYGTQDWQEVSMTVNVPEGTDFITLRCVLLGTGSAWFDDISVSRVEKEAAKNASTKKSSKAFASSAEEPSKDRSGEPGEDSDEDASKDRDEAPPSRPAKLSASPADTPPEPTAGTGATASAAEKDAVVPLVTQLETEVKRLRDANVILTDTLQEIQDVNQELLQEMLSVQAELRALRAEKSAAGAPPLDPARPRVPPIVPLSEADEYKSP